MTAAGRAFLAGTLILLFGAPIHLMGYVSNKNRAPADATEAQLRGLMEGYTRNFTGVTRSYRNLYDGLSLSFVVLVLLIGLLNLIVLRLAGNDPHILRSVSLANVGCLAIAAILSAVYMVPAPAFMFLAASASFGIAFLMMETTR
jgi:hypothetical protein